VPDQNIERITSLNELLYAAIARDPSHPESYYHLARYFERYGKPKDEKPVLAQALEVFAKAPELSGKRISYHIDTLRRYARLLVNEKQFLSAEEQLTRGVELFEDAVRRQVLRSDPAFGRLYADLADIEYFKNGDLAAADQLYRKARRMGWSTPEQAYRVGYIAYFNKDWQEALERFFEAYSEMELNPRLLFALANASYQRGNLHAAQSYYNRLLDLLELERTRAPAINPAARADQATLVERLMFARNNLGVTLELLARAGGPNADGLRSRALALYTESARAWDALTRDPDSMIRSPSTNLAFLNTRGVLQPKLGFEPQIYDGLEKDAPEPSEWEKLLRE
jgi:tetratricopeptide (TPR) repeat protein